MSVLVKGMEMPENCFECALQTDCGTCGFYSLYVEAGHEVEINKRREDCPLIEVPEPHGRLIDADVLQKRMIEYGWHHPDSTVHEFLEDDAPTVIEAEGKKEE